MSTPFPKAIFFDWDGTLADTAQMVVDAHNHVRTLYNKPLISFNDIFGKITKSAREVFPEIYGEEHALKAEEELYKFTREKRFDYLKPLPGAVQLLEFLTHHNIPVGIVSNKRHEGLGQEIEGLNWSHMIAIHVGAGEAAEDKPSAAPLLLALERLGTGLNPSDIWYVGDTEADLLCAKNAGSPCIFVPHEHGKRELYDIYKPLHMFETLDEFTAMLAEHLKKRA
jgi:phosphoglycolate phosphatase